MLALRLPVDLEKRLEELAKKTGRSKSYYARLAIEEFLQDQEDYLLAISRLEKELPGIPIDEVKNGLAWSIEFDLAVFAEISRGSLPGSLRDRGKASSRAGPPHRPPSGRLRPQIIPYS